MENRILGKTTQNLGKNKTDLIGPYKCYKLFLYKHIYYPWNMSLPGQPSIEKCKKARLKREEAQELAELDLSNIITTQGNGTWFGISRIPMFMNTLKSGNFKFGIFTLFSPKPNEMTTLFIRSSQKESSSSSVASRTKCLSSPLCL